MAAQAGRDLLIKIGDGGSPESFTTVAGLRAATVSLNAKTVDATDADSAQLWRTLVPEAGVKSLAVSGSGVFKDAASDAALRAAFFAAEARTYQLIAPDFGVFEGTFQIAALEYSGRYDGEAQFSLSLASAGPIAFTAAS